MTACCAAATAAFFKGAASPDAPDLTASHSFMPQQKFSLPSDVLPVFLFFPSERLARPRSGGRARSKPLLECQIKQNDAVEIQSAIGSNEATACV